MRNTKYKDLFPAAAELRRQAEEQLRAKTTEQHPHRTEEVTQRLVHELEVHRIELEMQNEELYRSHDELELSRNKYAELYDFAPFSYFLFDAHGVIREVNLAGAQLLGIKRGELINRPFSGFIADGDGRGIFARHLETVLRREGLLKCEIRLTGKDNTVIHSQLQSVTLDAIGSEVCKVISSIVDVTAAKLLETKIQDAREYAENIVETVREPLVVLNSDLKILTANHSFYETFKVTPKETIGNFIYDVGNRQWDIPKLRVLIEEILPNDTVINGYEVEHDFPDIGSKTILLNARQISRENIGSRIILLAMEDITARKQLEAEIQDAREYAENIVETVREPLVVLNSDLKILTANNSFYETFKVTPKETIGNFIYDVGNRQWDIPKLRVLIEEILPNDTVFNDYEVEHDFPGIGHKIILLNARQIFRENIGSHIILLAMEDITERKSAETEINRLNTEMGQLVIKLKGANKEMESFSYSVSHDLRAPLRSIDGFSLALLEEYGDKLDGVGKDYLRRVQTATKKMSQLIEDILKLSRITGIELTLEKVGLSAIAVSVADELQTADPERKVEFVIKKGVATKGDPRLLKVVLDNLLGNAWKFTGGHAEARIEFGASDVAGKTVFFVRDNGAGFDAKYSDKLFATFQRLHSEQEFPGTGVGLALVQHIIHRHGGTVWAEGAVEQGATFYFTLQ